MSSSEPPIGDIPGNGPDLWPPAPAEAAAAPWPPATPDPTAVAPPAGYPPAPGYPQAPGYPPAPGSPPAPGYPPAPAPGYGQYPNGYSQYPPAYGYDPYAIDHPQGTLILVFGILGVVTCMPLGIAAWVMGNKALKEIDAAPGRYRNRSNVNAGRILGMVSVGIFSVIIAIYAVIFFALIVGSASSS